jgi:putative phosphoribosyl transferase
MLVSPLFRDRVEAGQALAQRLKGEVLGPDFLVLALPRGGVPVGFEISRILNSALDVLLVRKLGVPGHEELAMGAIASGGVRVVNEALIRHLGIPPAVIDQVTAREQQEIQRRERLYRDSRPPLPIKDRTVILVDDGLATGASILAGASAVRAQQPKRVIAAVPVASRDACEDLRQRVDQVVCAETPEPFYSVGTWYEDFSQTSDDEVRDLLQRASRERVA